MLTSRKHCVLVVWLVMKLTFVVRLVAVFCIASRASRAASEDRTGDTDGIAAAEASAISETKVNMVKTLELMVRNVGDILKTGQSIEEVKMR